MIWDLDSYYLWSETYHFSFMHIDTEPLNQDSRRMLTITELSFLFTLQLLWFHLSNANANNQIVKFGGMLPLKPKTTSIYEPMSYHKMAITYISLNLQTSK